ncbi:MAG: tRNA (adenosine(37)-N6)-dimethylallyltransferase MiaA, partial [Oscillospiraceae bacterium]
MVGPTASGKTRLGVELALALDGEVVSADSMQIYTGMEIATAKPTADERRGVPHHLIGFVSPEEEYSVARFVSDASAAIDDILAREKKPILVGGTGLYVSSLIDGILFSEQRQDPAVRARLSQQAEHFGNEEMHRRLGEIDPPYAASLHPNNRGRVLRA